MEWPKQQIIDCWEFMVKFGGNERSMAGRTPKGTLGTTNNKKRATDETPFALVYGTEVVLPTEAELPTITNLVVEKAKEN